MLLLRFWNMMNGNPRVEGPEALKSCLVFNNSETTAEKGITSDLSMSGGDILISAEGAQSLFNNKNFSISLWITNNVGGIFVGNDSMSGDSNRGYSLFFYPDNKTLHWSFQDDNDSVISVGTVTGCLENVGWHHIVMVNDNLNVSFYIDGVKRKTVTISSWTKSWYDTQLIKCQQGNYIDEVKFYNHALSEEEVLWDYRSPFFELAFENGKPINRYNKEAQEFSVNTMTVKIDDSSPVMNGYFTFNGTSDYIKLVANNTYKVDKYLTINVWAYKDNWSEYNSRQERIFSCTESGGYNIESDDKIRFSCNIGNDYHLAYGLSCSSLSSGWHMFTCSWSKDSHQQKFYIDGKLQQSVNVNADLITYNNNNCIFIGCEAGANSNPNGQYFKGNITGFKMWGSQLTDDEVLDLYTNNFKLIPNGAIKSNYISDCRGSSNDTEIKLSKGLVTKYPYTFGKQIRYIKDTLVGSGGWDRIIFLRSDLSQISNPGYFQSGLDVSIKDDGSLAFSTGIGSGDTITIQGPWWDATDAPTYSDSYNIFYQDYSGNEYTYKNVKQIGFYYSSGTILISGEIIKTIPSGTYNIRDFTSNQNFSGTITFSETGFYFNISSIEPMYNGHVEVQLYQYVSNGNESTGYLLNGEYLYDSSCVTSDGNGPHYQLVDLGSIWTIGGVYIEFWKGSSSVNHKLEVSIDGKDWETIDDSKYKNSYMHLTKYLEPTDIFMTRYGEVFAKNFIG